MAQNIGTLVGSAIRPIYDDLAIASAYSNELKGGHHVYATHAEMELIIEPRRDWGMLVTVYNDNIDSSKNKTYVLKYNYDDLNIMNNNNWIPYSPSVEPLNKEWIDSVSSIDSIPPVSPADGLRILISNNPTGVFATYENQLAIYNAATTTWKFYVPTNGWTVRVDSIPNSIFKFDGSNWKREFVNSVRYLQATSPNDLDYVVLSASASAGTGDLDWKNSNIVPVDSYSYSVYYITFGSTNSGTTTLQIDNLSTTSVKKFENGVLVDLASGDLIPGISYQVLWNSVSNVFQTSPPAQTVTTIGPAPDGSYTDGLYPFTPTTPIGTAVDNFNEVLKALVPPSAPDLQNWDLNPTTRFTNGGLSFDNTTSGYSSATQSPTPVAIKGQFNPLSVNKDTPNNPSNFQRMGITSRVTQPRTTAFYSADITGEFNSVVTSTNPTSITTPTVAYAVKSFGNGMTGTMSFLVNGVTVSSVDLTNSGAIDTTVFNSVSGGTSGFVLSAATSSKFPGGAAFETFMNRTGSYRLKRESNYIVEGYNYLVVRHDITPSSSIVLARKEFVADSSTAEIAATVVTPRLTSTVGNTKKFLSGIEYYNTNFSWKYESTLSNVFSNTYNTDTDALIFEDVSDSTVNNLTGYLTTSSGLGISSPTITNNSLDTSFLVTPNSTLPISMTFSLLASKRRINESLKFRVKVKKTVQGTFIGATVSSDGLISKDNWFVDTYPNSSTATNEPFQDENYRLQNGSSKYGATFDIHNVTSGNPFPASAWNSTLSLFNGSNQTNGLIVINDSLMYPRNNSNWDFSLPGNSTTNLNFGISDRNYQNCDSVSSGFPAVSGNSNYRTFTRWTYWGTGSKKTFVMNVTFEGVTWVNSNVPLTGNQCWFEVKLPFKTGSTIPGGTSIESSGSTTGWMDATKAFNPTLFGDGAGCFDASGSAANAPNTSGVNWAINFGSRGTITSGGYLLWRITMGPNNSGRINQVNIT
jgi:hypothetical protein